jgi:Ca-activated chloride channel family protein
MQTLAQNGNGVAACIDNLAEARRVLADEMASAMFPIADDTKIQVEFNPQRVAEYRLIGYETRMLRREDFNNDRVDAGEIGSGHSVTAIYELTPPGGRTLNEPLRYQPEPTQRAPTRTRLRFCGSATSCPASTKAG